MMNTSAPNFDRVARIYRWAEYASLGPLLQRARTYFLPQLRWCKRAMVLGDGDGRFLAQWLAQNPELQACTVDTSAAMLQLLRKNCERTSQNAGERVTLLHTPALETIPDEQTDVVVSHFFLDCLHQHEIEALMQNYASKLHTGALWVVSDFALPNAAWLRPFAAIYIRSLYLAFRVLTSLRVTQLPDPQAALRTAGFDFVTRHEWLNGLVYTEIWRLG